MVADCSSLLPLASVALVQVISSLALSFSLLCSCCVIGGPVAAPAASPVPVVLPAPGVPAQVVGVTDGDTITAIVDGRQIKVRLNGIDAPEKKQAFGNVSKQALSGLVFGKRVSIVDLGKDRYGRTIGEVFTPDGQQVEVAMVRLGFAWHYVKYAPRNTDLAGAELVARKARRGLWADAAPVPPWEFRKR